ISIPDVSLTLVSDNARPGVEVETDDGFTSGIQITVTDKTILTTSVSDTNAGTSNVNSASTYAYVYSTKGVDLSSSSNLNTDPGVSQIVISPNVFEGNRIYTIMVSVTNSQGATGVASLTIVGNSAPYGGTLTADPRRGYSIVDIFTLTCSGWTDSDVPLFYRFEADSSGGTTYSTSYVVPLCPYRELSFCSTDLFRPANGGNVTAVAYIKDSLGAVSTSNYVSIAVNLAPDVDPVEATDLVAAKIQAGDTSGISALAASAISYALRSNSTNSTSIDTKQQVRTSILDSAALLSQTNDGSVDSRLLGPVALVKEATKFDDPSDLSPSTIDKALSIVESVSKTEAVSIPKEAIESSISSVGNLVAASVLSGQTQNGSNSLSTRTESVLNSLGIALASSVVAGEDATEILTPFVTLLSQKQTVARILGAQTNLSTGGSVTMPHSLPLDPSQDVVLSVAGLSQNLHPSYQESSGVLTISLIQNGTTAKVEDLQENIQFYIPLGSLGSNASDVSARNQILESTTAASYINTSLVCRFWNATIGNWSTEGMTTLGISADGMHCSSSHLTSFNVAKEDREVQVEVNSISSEDVTADAFSYRNPMMLFCCIVVTVWIIALVPAFCHDMHLAEKYGETVSVEFWRKFNRMRRLRLSHRSWWHCFKMSRWGIQRRHPWCAIVFRHPGDFMTTSKRVNILMVLLFSMMTTCALLLDTKQKFGTLPDAFSAGILSSAMSTPLPFFLGYVHRRRVPPNFAVSLMGKGLAYTCFTYLFIALTVCLSMELEDVGGDDEARENNEFHDLKDAEAEAEHEEDANVKATQGIEAAEDETGEAVKADIDADAEDPEDGDDYDNDVKTVRRANPDNKGATEGKDFGDASSQGVLAIQAGATVGTMAGYTAGENIGHSKISGSNKDRRMSHKRELSGQLNPSGLEDKSTEATSLSRSKNGRLTPVGRTMRRVLGNEGFRSFEGTPSSKVSDTKRVTVALSRAKIGGMTVTPENEFKALSDELKSTRYKKKSRRACMQELERAKREKKKRAKHTGQSCLCCNVYSKRSLRVDTHYWSYRDIWATAVSVCIVLGCWFILAVLSWNLRYKYSGWVVGSIVAFAQDLVMRSIQLLFVEILLFAPCCCYIRLCCLDPKKADQEYLASDMNNVRVLRFTTGELGFEFFKLFVAGVDSNGQADKLGVKFGWKLVKIRHVVVNDDEEAFHELQDAHRTERWIDITFHTKILEQTSNGKIQMYTSNVAPGDSLFQEPEPRLHDTPVEARQKSRMPTLEASQTSMNSYIELTYIHRSLKNVNEHSAASELNNMQVNV
ncbi:hypothetical protein AAMO2058_001090300, partial [Amorphochlora amoebiformis]